MLAQLPPHQSCSKNGFKASIASRSLHINEGVKLLPVRNLASTPIPVFFYHEFSGLLFSFGAGQKRLSFVCFRASLAGNLFDLFTPSFFNLSVVGRLRDFHGLY